MDTFTFIEGNFTVEIEGINAGHFKAVDGLSAKKTGTGFGKVTLKKGYIVTQDLQDWWKAVQRGRDVRKTVTIHWKDEASRRQITWKLLRCRLKHWKTGDADAKDGAVVTEELTFVVEEMTRDS